MRNSKHQQAVQEISVLGLVITIGYKLKEEKRAMIINKGNEAYRCRKIIRKKGT
jgi:hypothetical protein